MQLLCAAQQSQSMLVVSAMTLTSGHDMYIYKYVCPATTAAAIVDLAFAGRFPLISFHRHAYTLLMSASIMGHAFAVASDE